MALRYRQLLFTPSVRDQQASTWGAVYVDQTSNAFRKSAAHIRAHGAKEPHR